MNKGFTIAEILVAIAITAIVGIIMVVIFTNTLRGSNKAQILAVIKQNGQAVLEIMDKTIRNADNVICPRGTEPTVSSDTLVIEKVIEKTRSYTRFRFIPPNDISKRCVNETTANGCILQDSPSLPPGADMEEFVITVCTDPMPSATVLTDTNPQTGVSVIIGSFTRNKQAGSKDNVAVLFTLGPGVQAPPIVAGQIEPVKFQTTIQLR